MLLNQDVKLMFKSLSQGTKSVTGALRLVSSSAPMIGLEIPPKSLEDQVTVYMSILVNGLECLDLYNLDILMKSESMKHESLNHNPTTKEDKESIDAFAHIFGTLEAFVFQEIFESKMPFLFDRMVRNSFGLLIPQFFLANTATSPGFIGLLLRFLVDRLEDLGSANQTLTNVMLRLFKLIFMAITLFPEKNEPVLRMFLGNLIVSSMKLSSKAKVPVNYFLLLRFLFRSISGGRFELLYQEVLPLLPLLFESLNSLLASPHKKQMKELFVELCLTVPVRLSVLLPFLSYLMRPLILSLSASTDLVSQGLRTLELCVDNLTQEFLEPMITPYIDDLIAGLWQHLKPLPYNQVHSHTAMRILGKLGGKNRRLMNIPSGLDIKNEEKLQLKLSFTFKQSEKVNILDLEEYLHTAIHILDDKDVQEYSHQEAFEFVKSCIPLIMDFLPYEKFLKNALDIKLKRKEQVDHMDTDNLKETDSPFSSQPKISFQNTNSLQNTLYYLFKALFAAAVICESLCQEAQMLLEHFTCHFTLLSIMEASDYGAYKPLEESADRTYDETGFLRALANAIGSEDEKKRALGEKCVIKIYDYFKSHAPKDMSFEDFPAFHILASLFCAACYDQNPPVKNGGCYGISILTSKFDLGSTWMLNHEMVFVKALLFVLKDCSPYISSANLEASVKTFSHVLKVCNRQEDDDGSLDRQAMVNSLVSLLISELSNSNSIVRETIQSAFQLLSDLTGNEVTEIMTPVRERFLSPIFAKPLRALPFAMQIGHIDAITYCLSLRPPLLSFSEELVRLIQEALALADAEDQALVSKSNQYKNATSLTNLRVVCIKLLSATMASSEFMCPKQAPTRSRIISVFFKSLYSKSTEVVECSYKGTLDC